LIVISCYDLTLR